MFPVSNRLVCRFGVVDVGVNPDNGSVVDDILTFRLPLLQQGFRFENQSVQVGSRNDRNVRTDT